ncbi:hypothetical protein [Achromobacter xylosoxidans]|uniref:hypothetical protein n=1 Tax=Alcaligenes xylosoxydans xylosoxydans TaxID=85698 RepID=UPI0022B8E232|nr:hypothetical protein [Achromobacter xylosoxidans]MCZ8393457.1 hypothetical protein [Achromobacter xylosoxidans]
MQENGTEPKDPPTPTKVDWTVLGVVPIAAWVAAQLHELGFFLKNEVPLAFLDLGLAQVIKASLVLAVSAFVTLQLVDAFKAMSSVGRRRTISALIYFGLLMGAIGAPGEESAVRYALKLLTTLAALFVSYLIIASLASGEESTILGALRRGLGVFSKPSVGALLDLGTCLLILGACAAYVGYRGGIATIADHTVRDVECGPFPEVLRKYGDLLLMQSQVSAGKPKTTELVPPERYKNWAFREVSEPEFNFRSKDFSGPCPQVMASQPS